MDIRITYVMVWGYGYRLRYNDSANSYILTPPTRIKLICDHGIVISTIMFLWCSNHNYKENAISFAVYTVTISSYNLHRIMMREWSVILLYTIISHVVMDKCQVRSLRHPERPEYPPPPRHRPGNRTTRWVTEGATWLPAPSVILNYNLKVSTGSR